MRGLKMLKVLTVGMMVLTMVACGKESAKPKMGEMLLPLKLGDDNSLNLEGQIVQNIFIYGQWIRKNNVPGLIVESFIEEDIPEDAEEAKEVICAEMVKSLMVTQGMPKEKIKTALVKYEDTAEGDALINAMDTGDYTCLVRVKAEKE